MDDQYIGVDVNGLLDRTVQLEWSSGRVDLVAQLAQPVVIASDDRKFILGGRAALLHPADRGWVRPLFAERDGKRHRVTDLLSACAGESGQYTPQILGGHFRSMAAKGDPTHPLPAEAISLAVPDDFSAEAQSRIFDALGSAGRYDPRHGWRSTRAVLLWRSIAAVFGWARTLPAEKVCQLSGQAVKVVSLLADRLLVSPLTLEVYQEGDQVFVTPMRSEAGRPFASPYPPLDLEADLIDSVSDLSFRKQLAAVGGGRDFARGHPPEFLLQDRAGGWVRPPHAAHIAAEQRHEVIKDLFGLFDEGGVTDPSGIVLVETPDADRGFPDRSWQELSVLRLRRIMNSENIFQLSADSVAIGCAEYAARLDKGLLTFFDYLPQIKVAALSEDEEHHEFISLLRASKVAGNQMHSEELRRRFAVSAGGTQITFYISKADEKFVRKSITPLPFPPERPVQIDLRIEQRPVSGHAHIDIMPTEPGALGPTRIALDWRSMEQTGDNEAAIIRLLDRDRPRMYPNCAPTRTDITVWEVRDVLQIIKHFLSEPLAFTANYGNIVFDLRKTLGTNMNPRARGVAGGADEYLRLFGSDGCAPEGYLQGSVKPSEIAGLVRTKIDKEVTAILSRSHRTDLLDNLLKDLLHAGSWMFSGAPESVVGYFHEIAEKNGNIGRRMELIGRVLSRPEDIPVAFQFICNKLASRRHNNPPWSGSTKDLKTATMLLEFNHGAPRLISTTQAETILRCAIGTLSNTLVEQGGRRRLRPQVFLRSIKAILLILRHRKAAPSFLSPPAEKEPASRLYIETMNALRGANEEALKPARHAPRIALDAVENAILFLEQSGGNPDIITVISRSEEEGDDDDDGN